MSPSPSGDAVIGATPKIAVTATSLETSTCTNAGLFKVTKSATPSASSPSTCEPSIDKSASSSFCEIFCTLLRRIVFSGTALLNTTGSSLSTRFTSPRVSKFDAVVNRPSTAPSTPPSTDWSDAFSFARATSPSWKLIVSPVSPVCVFNKFAKLDGPFAKASTAVLEVVFPPSADAPLLAIAAGEAMPRGVVEA